ncbi:Retrovirus-related Pol polyprotein from transposon TNT 1-94 [Sesbania bispinosa]|nr:Retrovirus-related Pol polyprotein from transposon TNT 1-94 [Sesbania bispinosa]
MAFGPEIGTTSTAVPERRPDSDSAEQAPNSVAGPAPKPVTNGGKFGKNLVYLRKEQAIPDSVRVQESDPPSLHEVTSFNPLNSNNSNEFVAEISEVQVDPNLYNLDLPIALRKGTRTCTQ